MPAIIKPVRGFPGYHVDSLGGVWSSWGLRRRAGGGRGTESFISGSLKQMKQKNHNRGYLAVQLRKEGEYYSFLVHRLVLDTFKGPCPEGMEGCHRDGDKHNNRLSNLYYGTRQQNMDDSVRLGQTAHGEKNSQAKLTAEDVLKIVELLKSKVGPNYRNGLTYKEIGDMYGVSEAAIGYIARGHRWRRVLQLTCSS